MRTDFRYTITADFDAEDENSTHLILSMNCNDDTDFEKIENVLANPSVNTGNLFSLLPILADDLSRLGITTVVRFTSNSWIRKQIFRWGMMIANRKFNKFGREKFVRQLCS